jgi:hypothetical protein
LTAVLSNENMEREHLARTEVYFYRDKDGSIPLLGWLDALPKKVQIKCTARISRLAELGFELQRPEADYLRDGIYELRASYQGVHYRVLYFFAGKAVVVLSHGTPRSARFPARR